MRRLKKGPLFVAVTITVLLALFGSSLVGGSGIGWFAGLVKPWFLVPLWAFYLVGLAYYAGGATVLYRILAHVDNRGDRTLCLALTVGVMSLLRRAGRVEDPRVCHPSAPIRLRCH